MNVKSFTLQSLT